MEVWKDISGYEGLYQVSNLGAVKRCFKNGKERILQGKADKDGYVKIILSKNQIKKHFRLHRLVAKAFIPNPENKPVVNHKDKNVRNNAVCNLEWVTSSENTRHGFLTGRNVHKSAVVQYTTKNEFVRQWGSIKDACDNLGLSYPNVSACCNGRLHTSGGYIWKYKEAE